MKTRIERLGSESPHTVTCFLHIERFSFARVTGAPFDIDLHVLRIRRLDSKGHTSIGMHFWFRRSERLRTDDEQIQQKDGFRPAEK